MEEYEDTDGSNHSYENMNPHYKDSDSNDCTGYDHPDGDLPNAVSDEDKLEPGDFPDVDNSKQSKNTSTSRSLGTRCSAINCDHTKKTSRCSFLPFPKNPELKQNWVIAMQRCHVDGDGKLQRNRLWEPKIQHRLCSCHFSTILSHQDNGEGNCNFFYLYLLAPFVNCILQCD